MFSALSILWMWRCNGRPSPSSMSKTKLKPHAWKWNYGVAVPDYVPDLLIFSSLLERTWIGPQLHPSSNICKTPLAAGNIFPRIRDKFWVDQKSIWRQNAHWAFSQFQTFTKRGWQPCGHCIRWDTEDNFQGERTDNCEVGFSSLVGLKTKQRNWINVDYEMRLKLSSLEPDIASPMAQKKKQHHSSH